MPQWKLLNAGLNELNTARDNSLRITFKKFRLGSGFNYTANASDTGLNGSLVYEGNITSVLTYNGDAVDVLCRLPANVGPFNFGEVVILLESGTPIAKLVYPTLQNKLQSIGGSGGSSWAIHAILKIAQPQSVVNIIDGVSSDIAVYGDFSSVAAPQDMASNPYQVLVYEPTDYGEPVHLIRQSSTRWFPANYGQVGSFTVSAVTLDSSNRTVATASWLSTNLLYDRDENRRYILQGPNGKLVGVYAISGNNAVLERNVSSWLTVGTTVTIYSSLNGEMHPLYGLKARLASSSVSGNGAGMVGYVQPTTPYNPPNFFHPNGSVGQAIERLRANQERLRADLTEAANQVCPVGSIIAVGTLARATLLSYGYWEYCNGGYINATGADMARYRNYVLQPSSGLSSFVSGGQTFCQVPDLRGVFLRGLDTRVSEGMGTFIDPDYAARTLNSLQTDAFRSHNHVDATYTRILRPPYAGSLTGSDSVGSGGEQAVGAGDSIDMPMAGGNETRPVNRAVYYFIRVKEYQVATWY